MILNEISNTNLEKITKFIKIVKSLFIIMCITAENEHFNEFMISLKVHYYCLVKAVKILNTDDRKYKFLFNNPEIRAKMILQLCVFVDFFFIFV